MDLHKTLQSIAIFENMQVLINCTYNQKQIISITHLTKTCFIKFYDCKPETYLFHDNLILN